MKLPKLIKIGGQEYSVELVDSLADSGSTTFATQRILINSNQNNDRQKTALLHEVIETLNELYDLNLNHQTIQTLEAGLYQVIKDNKLF